MFIVKIRDYYENATASQYQHRKHIRSRCRHHSNYCIPSESRLCPIRKQWKKSNSTRNKYLHYTPPYSTAVKLACLPSHHGSGPVSKALLGKTLRNCLSFLTNNKEKKFTETSKGASHCVSTLAFGLLELKLQPHVSSRAVTNLYSKVSNILHPQMLQSKVSESRG